MQGEVSGLNQIWSVQRQNCFSNTTRRQEGPSESHIGIHGPSLRSETPWVKSSSLSRDHPPELGSSHLDSGVGFSPAKAKTTAHNSLVCSEVAIKKKICPSDGPFPKSAASVLLFAQIIPQWFPVLAAHTGCHSVKRQTIKTLEPAPFRTSWDSSTAFGGLPASTKHISLNS